MKCWMLIALTLGVVLSKGQTFKGEASLPAVEKDGFYKIIIAPEIAPYLNDNLSDIRVYDSKRVEVPYVMQTESSQYHSERFVEYEILENKSKRGCCTTVLLRNAKKNPINNVHLIIKNAEAWRDASLQGSDDQKQWFALKDHLLLDAPNAASTEQIKIVGFPWSNYEFYRLQITDSSFAPLNILKAGYYEAESSDGKYTSIPTKINSADSARQKKTFVGMTLPSLQFIDKIEVAVSGAKYYRRIATLLEKRVSTYKNGTQTEYYNPVQNFELTSGRTAVVELQPAVRGQQFLIEIENHDNPPLIISSVKTFQLNRYLTVWLTAGEQYVVRFGQPALTSPIYDLGFFQDSIPKQLITLKPVNAKITAAGKTVAEVPFFSNKSVIWIAIIVVMIVLGVMSVKLVRESSKAEGRQ